MVDSSSGKVLAAAVAVQVFVMMVVGPCALVAGLVLAPSELARSILLLQIIGMVLLVGDLTWLALAHERFGFVSVTTVATAALRVALIAAVVRSSDDVVAYVIVSYLPQLGMTMAQFAYLSKQGLIRFEHLRFDFERALRNLRDAGPVIFLLVFGFIYNYSSAMILGAFGDFNAVSQFSTAYGFIQTASYLSTVATMNLYSAKLARAHDDEKEARSLGAEFFQRTVWIGCAFAGFAWNLGPDLINYIYGPPFAHAARLFEVLSISIAISGVATGLGFPLLVWHEQFRYSISGVLAGIVNLLINAVGIPLFGVQAAAVSAIVSASVLAIYLLKLRSKIHPINVLRLAVVPVAVTVLFSGASKLALLNGLFPLAIALLASYVCIGIWIEVRRSQRVMVAGSGLNEREEATV
ncbi:MAG: hypothetical protein KatS3mg060_0404 [Dehalococcoidia bacterium]|nr:MAG: hypothetical protein KatS3mg060_0404 [Dehalococcoidia bacterium]